MLTQLHIKNAALIEEADISFHKGLNILSGETGSGKSILIDSILFLLGARPGKSFIRNGEAYAHVEGLAVVDDPRNREAFNAMGVGVDEENGVLISRSLNDQGRSVCRLNGHAVPVGVLRGVAALLVDVHGQHGHQSLLNPAMHIKLLDQFCDIGGDKAALAGSLSQYRETIRAIKTIEGGGRDRAGRVEILRYQFGEISEAGIQPGEEEALGKRKAVLSSIGRITRNARKALACLKDDDNSASSLIADGIGLLREAGGVEPSCDEMAAQLMDIQSLLADMTKELSSYSEGLRDDPAELDEIEERLDLLYRLKKKYGGSVAEVIAHGERVKAELDHLGRAEQDLKRLNAEKKRLAAEMLSISERISQKRKERAAHIQNGIEAALKFLGMMHARFEVRVDRKNEFSPEGFDRVEFMISPNLGEPLTPLAKTASGGEMSRVMLAIKSVVAEADSIETFIFDEIDAGVSGRAAQQVAEKLRGIAKSRQILCITHLPQIAAMAGSHYLIEKKSGGGKTQTFIHEMDRGQQIAELARLIGGARITGATLKAAEEMKDLATK